MITSRIASERQPLTETYESPSIENDGVVRIGDLIYLWAESVGGSVLADGFDEECIVLRHRDVDSIPLECLFEIRVQHSYKAQRNLEEASEKKPDLFAERRLSFIENKGQGHAHYEVEADEEKLRNQYETARSSGAPVVYGHVVQLFHLKSSRFLSLHSNAATYKMDANKPKQQSVQVVNKGDESCWFRLEPRYKIKQFGDLVHYWDSVVLSAANSNSDIPQTLCCCCESRGSTLSYGNKSAVTFNLCSSTDTFAWKLRLFRPGTTDVENPLARKQPESQASSKDHVRGGDILRLVHKDLQAYLSFAELPYGRTEEIVRLAPGTPLLINGIANVVDAMPAFSLWKLELEDGASGATAMLECTCRLQHVVTGKYLAYSHVGNCFLMVDDPSEETHFQTEPVFMTEGPLKWQGCIHLQHKATGTYIHAENYVAAVSDRLLRQDAFSVEQVPWDLVQEVLHLLSASRALNIYLTIAEETADGAAPNYRTKYNHRYMLDMLKNLCSFCQPSRSPAPSKFTHVSTFDQKDQNTQRCRRQQLFRDLGILDNAFKLSKLMHTRLDQPNAVQATVTDPTAGPIAVAGAAFGSTGPSAVLESSIQESKSLETATTIKLFNLAHEVLQQAIGDNEGNRQYLSNRINELVHQILSTETSVPATETIMEMFNSNPNILNKVQSEQIQLLLDQIDQDPINGARYMKILSRLISCKGKGMVRNQDVVIDWFKERGFKFLITTRLSLPPNVGSVEVAYPDSILGDCKIQKPARKTKKGLQIDLELLCGNDLYDMRLFELYEGMILLLISLSLGAKTDTKEWFQKHASYDTVLHCMALDSLPMKLRSYFTSLMHHLYIEQPAVHYLSINHSTQLLGEIDSTTAKLPTPLFEPAKEHAHFRSLKKVIISTLTDLACNDSEANKDEIFSLILSTCRLCKQLLTLGFFSSEEDIQNVLTPPLLALLSFYNRTEEMSPSEAMIKMDFQLEMCSMLNFICDIRLNVRIVRLLALFKATFLSNKSMKPDAELHRLAEKMKLNNRDEIDKVLAYLAFPNNLAEGDVLSSILVSMMQRGISELSVSALKLLLRDMSPKIELYKTLMNTQILIDPAAISAYKQCHSHVGVIRKLLPALKACMANPSEKHFTPSDQKQLGSAIEQCATFCGVSHVVDGKDAAETLHENHEIVRRSGIHKMILDIIRSAFHPYGDPEGTFILREDSEAVPRQTETLDWLRERILKPCFHFIEQFCAKSEINQGIIVPHVLLLVSCMDHGLHVTKALTAIYSNNEALCRIVDEHVIIRIFEVLAGKRNKGNKRRLKAHYLRFLQTLCKVEEGVIGRNQVCIIKYLSDNGPLKLHTGGPKEKEEQVLVLFRGREGEARREKLVQVSKDRDGVVQCECKEQGKGLMEYHMALLRLLQTLLIDHLPEVCALVRVMLPPEKIRDDILSHHCNPRAKGELLHLMRELYLSNQVARRHPLLSESLWDMVKYEARGLKQMGMERFSRYSQEEGDKESQWLLLECWAPLLLAMFSSQWLMRSLSEVHKSVANDVMDRLIELLNHSTMHHSAANKLYQVYLAARDHHISGASILSDKAAAAAKAPPDGGEEALPAGARMEAGAGTESSRSGEEKSVQESVGLFARVLLEVMDPPWRGGTADFASAAGGVEVGRGDVGQEEPGDGSELIRCELRNLSRVLVNPATPRTVASPQEAPKKEFKADLAGQLIDLLVKYERDGEREGDGWEADMIVCLRLLRVLVMEWHGSATAVQPPAWLEKGVPRLVMHLIRGGGGSDATVLCALELAIAALNGGSRLIQTAFHRALTSRGSTPVLAELRRRIHAAEGEARVRYHEFREVLAGRRRPDPLLPDRSLHTLVVLSGAGRPPPAATHVDKLFRFLQLLCEGQNLTLQNYLRHQPESAAPVDLVSAMAAYIDAVTGYLNPWTAVVATKAINALAETVMNPCRPNQRLLVDTKLCTCANEILDRKAEAVPGLEVDYGHVLNELKAGTVIALLSLLECVDGPYIPDRMLSSLNMTILLDNINFLLRTYNPTLLLELKVRRDKGTLTLHMPKQLDASFWQVQPLARPDDMELLLDHARAAEVRAEEQRREDAEQVALYLYIIFKTLSGYDLSHRLQRLCQPELIWDLENLRRKVGVIEISRKGVLEKAYFIVPDVCRFLTEASKDEVKTTVDRTNLQTQLADFTGRFDTLYQEMRHQQRLSRHRILRGLQRSSPWRERLFLYNAMCINVVLLVGFAYQCNGSFTCGDNEELTDYRLLPAAKNLCQALICIQLVLSVVRQVWYVIERGVLKARQRVILAFGRSRPRGRTGQAGGGRDAVVRGLGWCLGLGPSHKTITHRHQYKCRRIAAFRAAAAAAAAGSAGMGAGGGGGGVGRMLRVWLAMVTRIERLQLLCWLVAAVDPVLIGHGLITVSAVLALTLQSQFEAAPLLLLAHLFEVLNQSPVLRNVIRSITYRGNSLLQTGMLALILYYLFGVVGFVVFPELFQFDLPDLAEVVSRVWMGAGGQAIEPNNNNARCTSIWKCTLIVFDVGLRKLDIGYGMKNLQWKVDSDDPDRYRILYRMVYTFLFYVMVTTILMNIIFGIIIDTFAELREKKDKVSTGGRGFEEHVTNEHNMWHYLFFQVYLREKEVCEYSGGESYVFAKSLSLIRDDETHEVLRHPDTGHEIKVTNPKVDLLWFPQRDAMVLKTQRTWSEQALLHKITTLDRRLQSLAADITRHVDKLT